MMKTKVGTVFVMISLGLAAAVYGAEYNFYAQADKKGCVSIITERGQDECARVQRAKDDACSVPVVCEVDQHERLIAKYKEQKERLNDCVRATDYRPPRCK